MNKKTNSNWWVNFNHNGFPELLQGAPGMTFDEAKQMAATFLISRGLSLLSLEEEEFKKKKTTIREEYVKIINDIKKDRANTIMGLYEEVLGMEQF